MGNEVMAASDVSHVLPSEEHEENVEVLPEENIKEEITKKVGRRIRKSSGGSPGTAYIQVIPLNGEAGDLNHVKDLLTNRNFPYKESTTEITSIAATTECAKKERSTQCQCEDGFQFDLEQCRSHPSCYIPLEIESFCFCPNLNANSTVYCEEPPTSPGQITSSPYPAMVGSDLVLEFSSAHDVTNIRWFLVNVLSSTILEVHNGTTATVVTSSRKSTLTIKNIPRYWGGLYICRFDYRTLHWQNSHMVEFPLSPSDIAPNPPNAFLWNNFTTFPGITVECCIPDDGRTYYVYWEPGHIISDPVYRGERLCFPLTISDVPGEDTDYRCIFEDDLDTVVESRVHVGVISDTDRLCTEDGDDRWKGTKAGYDAEIPCDSDKRGRITRSCSMSGEWAAPQASCMDVRLLALLEQAQRLVGGLGTPGSDIPQMMERLRNYTVPSRNHISDPGDIITVVETITLLSTAAEENNMQIYTATMSDLLTVSSRLLHFPMRFFWTPALIRRPFLGSMFLKSVENISKLYEPDSASFMFFRPNVQMNMVVLSPLVWTDYSKSFNTTPTVSVVIKGVDMSSGGNVTTVTILLRNLSKILPVNFGESVKGHGHRIASYVIANTIRTGNQSRREADLDMVFLRRKEPNRTDDATAQCVFWDDDLFEGSGGWSTEGCRTTLVNGSVVCRYRRVAAFSVLMSRGVFEDDVLEPVSQAGAFLSILCLLICLVVYFAEWKFVVKDDVTFYRQISLINICVSMFIADAWFLGSTFIRDSTHANKLCVSAAFFQHYFYLAMLSWMMIQGLILLYELVFSSYHLIRVAVISAMVGIGYVCPLVVASATIGIDYPKEGYITEGAMAWNVFQPPSVEEPPEEEDNTKFWVSRGLTLLTTVFGIIMFLESAVLIDGDHEDFYTALEIINSFQGVIILIIGLLLDRRIREALGKVILKFLALFSFLKCCPCNSYNVEQNPELEAPETYRQMEDS
ncbi:adhesion G-protein coupled receptor F3 [Hyla sarda]|uniref:adhesion G-protein coupled receptor F3 n=1 Tax=Hyla sarda TaxID=327740 RepID=UPI0024C368A4|nr:adhesion G-protein coupled receptor F3 [Hyla sarda]